MSEGINKSMVFKADSKTADDSIHRIKNDIKKVAEDFSKMDTVICFTVTQGLFSVSGNCVSCVNPAHIRHIQHLITDLDKSLRKSLEDIVRDHEDE